LSRYHNRKEVLFDDAQFKKILDIRADMIIKAGEEQNTRNATLSEAIRYLVTEGLKNYEFYTRYNARVDATPEPETAPNNQNQSLQAN